MASELVRYYDDQAGQLPMHLERALEHAVSQEDYGFAAQLIGGQAVATTANIVGSMHNRILNSDDELHQRRWTEMFYRYIPTINIRQVPALKAAEVRKHVADISQFALSRLDPAPADYQFVDPRISTDDYVAFPWEVDTYQLPVNESYFRKFIEPTTWFRQAREIATNQVKGKGPWHARQQVNQCTAETMRLTALRVINWHEWQQIDQILRAPNSVHRPGIDIVKDRIRYMNDSDPHAARLMHRAVDKYVFHIALYGFVAHSYDSPVRTIARYASSPDRAEAMVDALGLE